MTFLAIIFAVAAVWFVLRAIAIAGARSRGRTVPGSEFWCLTIAAALAYLAYLSFTGAPFLMVLGLLILAFAALYLVASIIQRQYLAVNLLIVAAMCGAGATALAYS